MTTEPSHTDATHLVRAMFTSSISNLTIVDDEMNDGCQVVCPFCHRSMDGYYVQIDNTRWTPGNDNYDAADEYPNLGVRGDVTAIHFSAECGHHWALAFGFHKGWTFVRVVRLTEEKV